MEKKQVNIKEFIKFITHHMTAEEALEKLLKTSVHTYTEGLLKYEEGSSPYFVLANAAMDLG